MEHYEIQNNITNYYVGVNIITELLDSVKEYINMYQLPHLHIYISLFYQNRRRKFYFTSVLVLKLNIISINSTYNTLFDWVIYAIKIIKSWYLWF